MHREFSGVKATGRRQNTSSEVQFLHALLTIQLFIFRNLPINLLYPSSTPK